MPPKPSQPQPAAKKPAPAKGKKEKVRTLTEEEVADLKETFDLFDEDKSGTIDPEEITKAMNNMDLQKRNPIVFSIISHLEKLPGPLDFETFVDSIQEKLGDTKTREGLRKLFDFYIMDEETDVIKFANLKKVAKELGETMNDDELHEMMHHIHVLNRTENKDEISFDDFYEIITNRKY
jgi:Ca2+-binding EF-hand superfamily protein